MPPHSNKTQWAKIHAIAFARALSLLGTELSLFTLVFREKDQGPLAVAALFVVAAIPAIALSPITGWMADRFSTRSIIPALSLVGGLALIFQTQSLPTWLVLVLLFISASCGLAVANAWGKVVRSLAIESDFSRVSGVVQTYFGLAMLMGPFVAGILVSATGYVYTFLFDALATTFIGLVPFVTRANFIPERAATGERLSMTGGFKNLITDKFIRNLTILFFAVVFCVSVVNVGDVFLMTKVLHADAFIYGLVGGGFALGTVVASVGVAKIKVASRTEVTFLGIGIATLAAAGVLVGIAPNYWFVMVVWFVAGLGNALVNSFGIGLMTKRVPMELQGRTFAAFNGISSVASIGSQAIAGVVLGFVDVRLLFVSAGILALVSFLVFFPGVRKAILA